MPPTDKKKPEAPKKPASKSEMALGTIPTAMGLATTIGTAIPQLKRPKKNTSASRAAALIGQRAGGQVQGGFSTGGGASRGLLAREGARQAQQQTRQGAEVAGRLALAEAQQHGRRMDVRNNQLAQFGRDATDAVATTAQGFIENKALKEKDVPKTGSDEHMEDIDAFVNAQEAQRAGLTGAGPTPPPQLEAPAQQGPGPVEQAQGTPAAGQTQLQMPSLSPQQLYQQALGLPPAPVLNMAPEMERQLRMQQLAMDEANRTGTNYMAVMARVNRLMQQEPSLSVQPLQAPGYDGEHEDVMNQFGGQ